MEPAAAGECPGCGNAARNGGEAVELGAELGYRPDQGLRIRMERMLEHLPGRAGFDDLPGVQDRHLIRQVAARGRGCA